MAQDTPSSEPVYLVGGGGHGRVVLDAAQRAGHRVVAVVDPGLEVGSVLWGVPVAGGDEVLDACPAGARWLNGIGANPYVAARQAIFQRLAGRVRPADLFHPNAAISDHARIGAGVQVMAGAVVQAGCVLGDNCVVNTGARIDHDCDIGAHGFIAPGVTLCGEVTVGAGSFIGAGAVVLPGLRIGAGVVVAAGAVVIASLPDGARVAGNPARLIEGKSNG